MKRWLAALLFLAAVDVADAQTVLRGSTEVPQSQNAVRCLNADGTSFVSCGGGVGGGGGDGVILDGGGAGQADVIGSAPAGTEQGLVVRPIPSGTQTVKGAGAVLGESVAVRCVNATNSAFESCAGAGGGGSGLTDAELRASPVPVSGPLTDAQLRATPVPVDGPLTDTELRATPVPVSGTFWQATQPVSGPLTDAQLRATAVPVSGPLTDAQLRATPVPVSGTVTATGPLTDTELRATPVPISGTVTIQDGGNVIDVQGTVSNTPPTGGSATQVQGTVAHDSAAAQNPVPIAGVAEIPDDAAPANRVSAEGDVTRVVVDRDGAVYTHQTPPHIWTAQAEYTSQQTDTSLRAAPGASLSLYVTDITITCGSATAVTVSLEEDDTSDILRFRYYCGGVGDGVARTLRSPIKFGANRALLVTTSAAQTVFVSVGGFTAP